MVETVAVPDCQHVPRRRKSNQLAATEEVMFLQKIPGKVRGSNIHHFVPVCVIQPARRLRVMESSIKGDICTTFLPTIEQLISSPPERNII
ncbi:hypothetical protein J6590_011682 [Homalodisca vitripennis]|nr:hypothetical protein J6590_011682 [Homalodisca vitripennis]